MESRINHATHIPFYTVGFYPKMGLPVDKLLNGDVEPDAFDIKYGAQTWMAKPMYVRFLKECLNRGMYHIIFLSDVMSDSKLSKDALKGVLLSRVGCAIVGNTTHFPKAPLELGVGTFQFMFDCVRLCNSFTLHAVKYGSAGERKKYLANMFFLAEQLSPRKYNPLIVGMVEKSRIVEARKCFINNVPMPTDLLEIWIDSSVEEVGSKLKPLFRKYLKFGAENAGLTIKTFPDLNKEVMFDVMPPVNTMEEVEAGSSKLLNVYYDFRDGKYEMDLPDVTHADTFVNGVSRDIDEVFATIGD